MLHIPVRDLILRSLFVFGNGNHSKMESLFCERWEYKLIQISIPSNIRKLEANIAAVCCLVSVLNFKEKWLP